MNQSPFKYDFKDIKLDNDLTGVFSFQQTTAECNVILSRDEWIEKTRSPLNLKLKKYQYDCSVNFHDSYDNKKPTIIITINNNSDLLKFTVSNFESNGVLEICNVVIVDDRSTEDLKSIVLDKKLNYVRVDTDMGFNFSMLNNIGANIVDSMGGKQIIIWNSDLWCPNPDVLPEILRLHNEDNSKFSGTKLLYPTKEETLNDQDYTYNIANHFPQIENWRGKVQFGGDYWIFQQKLGFLGPMHFGRFFNPEDPRVNCNRGISFMTGAFHLFELEHFKDIGGYNPSLVKAFQDVDICLRSIEAGVYVSYYGKDLYLYHDESYSFYSGDQNKKHDKRHDVDHMIYYRMWGQKTPSLTIGR